MNPYVRSLGAHVERALRHGFEEDADWLVEMLEREREQVAYALALEGAADLRPSY